MFKATVYPYVVLSVTAGLLTLLGSVGIFISLIIQRRVERLQAILEEFIDLSYQGETNLTGKMHILIEKYQMHYILPQHPRSVISIYIDITLGLVMSYWLGLLFWSYQSPWNWISLLELVPLFIGFATMLFFRWLLKNTISLEKPFLDSIIPHPTKLRSVSYLSKFVNVSVKSLLKQARLTFMLVKEEKNESSLKVILKEELSFDDFFYYLVIAHKDSVQFTSFGEIKFYFANDSITGKPCPVQRNLNIPLGNLILADEELQELRAEFLIFAKAEKHPIQYTYYLKQGTSYLSPTSSPEVTVNHQITYCYQGKKINIVECQTQIENFCDLIHLFRIDGHRYFINALTKDKNNPEMCQEEIFID